MENEIYDYNFHRYGYLEQIEYLSYTDKLYECGSFQIKCPAIQKNIDLLKNDRIIFFEYDIAGVIQSVEYMQQNSQMLDVSGNLIDIFLDWRYVYPTILMNNVQPHVFMQEIVRRNFVTCPAIRKFPRFEVQNVAMTEAAIDTKQQTGDSVLEVLLEFAPTYNLGFHIGMDRRNKKFVFSPVPGVDHTINNTAGNKKLLFSDDMNNILECYYTNDNASYRNTALVVGERGDETRESVLVFNTTVEKSGWDRREIYVDARDLQSTKEVETTDEEGNPTTENVEMSQAEYQALLRERGKDKLSEWFTVESFEAEVNNNLGTQFVYQEDYRLGDKVTAIKQDLGVYIDAQITEIQITYDKSGYTVSPTIGNSRLSLYSKLRRG